MHPVRLLTLTGGLSSETRSLVDAMTVKPTSTRMRRIDRVIRGLKQSGVWDKLDVFYMLAAHDEQAGRLNWKRPGTYTASAVSSPTFTTDRGFAGDGLASYLDTGWGSSVGTNYLRDSSHMGVWCTTDVSGTSVAFGTGGANINPRNAGNMSTRSQSVASNAALPAATSIGYSSWSRRVSTEYDVYKNGADIGTVSVASSTGTAATTFTIGASNTAGTIGNFDTRQIAAAHTGGALSDAEMAALYSSLLAYLQGVGAA
jgi:hypothetical protein